jgi:TolB-like protein
VEEHKRNSEITIAIFPFENLSEHNAMPVLCKSFYIDLVTELSRFRQFHIVNYEPLQNRNDIPVDYSIKGSFRFQDNILKIHAQLNDNHHNRIVWADRYEGDKDSIFTIQENLLERVVSTLQLQVNHDLLIRLRKKPAVSLSAYEHWLSGTEELKKGTLESDETARIHFQQALEIDPGYSLAYSGMSLTYFNEWSCQLWERWDISQQGAFDWARKAIELDEQNYIAALVLGRVYLYESQYDVAELYLRKALHLNPNDTDNLIQIASCFVFLGHLDEAEELYRNVLQRNPLHASNYDYIGAFIAFERGEFKKCIALSANDKSPWIDSTSILAAAYYEAGDVENMHKCWNRFLQDFQRKIVKRNDPVSSDEALQWIINVSPYKNNSRAQAFWQFIGGKEITISSRVFLKTTPAEPPNYFLREGDLWQLSFDGKTIRIADAKGLHDLVRLLGNPQKQFHCTELMGSDVRMRPEPAFDEKAKRSYQRKILELQEEIRSAESNNDLQRTTSLHKEYDDIVHHLTTSLGLGGRVRNTNDPLDKTRSAVTWRIRSIIQKIEKNSPALGKHLASSVRTGVFCSYNPEKAVPWIIAGD